MAPTAIPRRRWRLVRAAVVQALDELCGLEPERLLARRYAKLRRIGAWIELSERELQELERAEQQREEERAAVGAGELPSAEPGTRRAPSS
ncbi:MAG: hypothetical protein KatS3mg102_0157 [Planctomycetota bacterium]|nr:MAG: hypothetical protein KatS3mg102_0157 [Planctomycetota bacterium]